MATTATDRKPIPHKSKRIEIVSVIYAATVVSHQLVELVPGFNEVIGNVECGQVVAAGQTVQRVDLIVRHPQLLQCAGHIFELLDLHHISCYK